MIESLEVLSRAKTPVKVLISKSDDFDLGFIHAIGLMKSNRHCGRRIYVRVWYNIDECRFTSPAVQRILHCIEKYHAALYFI